jgi:large subunit ribosomal protein L30
MPSAKKPVASAGRVRKSAAKSVPAKKPARRTAAPRVAGEAHAEEAPRAPEAAAGPSAPRTSAGRAAGATITIEQYASGICCPKRQKRVLRALGLRHPRQRVVRPDNPAVRGMVNAIPHLVRIEEEKGGA